MADDALQAYYERDRERDRLATRVGRVEFERTIEIIGRTLTAAPAVVADIGGGPGRYTDYFVDQGYTVRHRDVVPHHVDQVAARHDSAVVDTAVGDARALDLATASVDAVLLLGPLYHLSDPGDRTQAVAEAVRITKPGGMIYGAAIGKWSARIQCTLIDQTYLDYPEILAHLGNTEAVGDLTPTFEGAFVGNVHTAEELADDFAVDGIELDAVLAVESVAAAFHDDHLDARLANDVDRRVFYESLRALEAVPELMGVSAHLLAVARRC